MKNKNYDFVVYKTTDLKTGLIYIGYDSYNKPWYYGSGTIIRKVILKRLKTYVENVLNETFDNSIYTYRNKYKKEYLPLLFTKEILSKHDSMEDMIASENVWIEKFDSRNPKIGYNLAEGGHGGKTMEGKSHYNYGGTLSNEHKEKISISLRGEKNPMYNKHHSEDAILLMKEKKKNKYCGENNPMYNKHHKEESKKLMRDRKIGKKLTEEHIKNLSLSKKNKRKVYQYKKENDTLIFIKEYDSINNALLTSGVKTLRACLSGRTKQAGGYIFTYNFLTNDDIQERLKIK